MTQRIDSDCVLEGMRAVKALLLGEGKALHILRYHDVRKYVRKLMVDGGLLMPLQAYLFVLNNLYRLICVIAS